MPVAVKIWALPLATDALTGVIVMPVRSAGVTVILAVGEVMPFIAADTVVLPTAAPITMPVFAPTVAVAGVPDVQLTCVVRLAVVLSE